MKSVFIFPLATAFSASSKNVRRGQQSNDKGSSMFRFRIKSGIVCRLVPDRQGQLYSRKRKEIQGEAATSSSPPLSQQEAPTLLPPFLFVSGGVPRRILVSNRFRLAHHVDNRNCLAYWHCQREFHPVPSERVFRDLMANLLFVLAPQPAVCTTRSITRIDCEERC